MASGLRVAVAGAAGSVDEKLAERPAASTLAQGARRAV